MANFKNQPINKDGKAASSAQKNMNASNIPTGRPDLNEINKRNAEEAKQERKSVYNVAGVLILLIGLVVLLVYFFS